MSNYPRLEKGLQRESLPAPGEMRKVEAGYKRKTWPGSLKQRSDFPNLVGERLHKKKSILQSERGHKVLGRGAWKSGEKEDSSEEFKI